MSNNLVTRMQNAVNDANTASNTTYQVLTGPLDTPIDVNGVQVPTLNTRVRDFLDTLLAGGSLDGEDGASIENIDIDSNGHLIVTITDQAPKDLGKIIPEDGIGVNSVVFNATDGSVEFELDDGRKIKLNDVAGEDGATVVSARIETGDLIFTMTDGNDINAGDISRFGGTSASDAEINEAGELVIIFSDGSTENVGKVVGPRGENGLTTIAGSIDLNGVLRLYRSDGSQYNIGQAVVPLLDSTGNTIDGARLGGTSNKELILELSTGDLNIGQVVGDDGIDGDDGVSVADIYIDDNDNNLYVRLSNESTASALGEVRTTIFEGADVAVTDASINTSGELILDISVNGSIQTKNVGVVHGDDGTVLSTASFDATTGVLTFTDTDGNDITAGNIDQVQLTGASVDETTGMLTLELSDSTTIDAGVVRGEDGADGVGVDNVYMDTEGDLYVSFTDTNIPDGKVGNILAPVETGAAFDANDHLIVTLSDGQTFDLGKVKGVDGAFVESIRVEDSKVMVKYSNSATEVDIGSADLYPTNASVTSDGKLEFTMSDNSTLTTPERVKPVDGDTITGASFDTNNRDLIFDLSTDDQNTTSQVKVPAVRGRGIENLKYDDSTRLLTFNTNDPTDDPHNVSIKFEEAIDGDSVTDIRVENEQLILETNIDGKSPVTIDLPSSLSIVDVTQNTTNNDIIIELSDGNTFTLETIEGFIGVGIDTVTYQGNDLVFTLTDDSTVTVPAVLGTDGDGITDIQIDGTDLVISNTIDASPLRFPQLKGIDAPNSITGISFNGTDLIVDLVDAPQVVVPMVKGEDGRGILDIAYDGVDLVITTDITGKETITIPSVKGVDGNSVLDVQFVDNDLVVTTNITGQETITIPMVRGVDGNSVESITVNGNDVDITTNITGQENIKITDVKGIDGNSVESITVNGNDVDITTNITGQESITITDVKGVDGEDGATISSGVIDANDNLVLTMNDDPTTPTVYTITGVGAAIETAEIVDATGQLQLNLTNGEVITTTDSIMGRDGNGKGIESVSFVDERLTIELSDATGITDTIDAGTVSLLSVTNARIDESTNGDVGELVFELSDGTEQNVGNVYGKDGRFVASVELDASEHLILTMSDGSTIDAGYARGADGISVESAEVLFSGDLLITYSDGSVDNAGSVGSGAGLTVWNVDAIPYVKDRVVIYNGGLYMSAMDNNNDEPPSGNWIPLALGDQLIEVRKPRTISPINSETSYSVRPTLVGSPYAAIVSIDEQQSREYQIAAETDVDFNTVLFTYSELGDSFEITDDLSINTTYLWRCRDISDRGYVSAWSDPATFVVPEGIINMPTVSINPDEDINSTYEAPNFMTTAFSNDFDTNPHTDSDWQVRNATTDEMVFESLGDTTNLESIIIPVGILSPSTNYEIRAKHRTGTIESPWSDWVIFTTEDSFDYIEQPVVYYDGNLAEVSLFDATFTSSAFSKTDAFDTKSGTLPLVHQSSTWEVVNIDTGGLVETDESGAILTEYTLSTVLESNTNYRIRVKYNSERFGSSDWSDWVNFNAVQMIERPVVTTTEDVNGFPSGGVFQSSTFEGVNESHESTDWQVRNFDSDVVEWESLNDTVNMTQLVFDEALPDGDYYVVVRYNGVNVSSEWSTPFDFYYGTPA